MPDVTDRLDLIVLGATGFTGRLVARRLAALQFRAQDADKPFPTWGVAGRNRSRLQDVVDSLGPLGRKPTVLDDTDVRDLESLTRVAVRCRVLLNLVGPYTSSAEQVIAACVDNRTHYADLSGELPLLRRVIDRFHDRATDLGVRVVQLAGWEALAPDITGLHACRAASGSAVGEWGLGAAQPVEAAVDRDDVSRATAGCAAARCPPALSAASSRFWPTLRRGWWGTPRACFPTRAVWALLPFDASARCACGHESWTVGCCSRRSR